MKLGQPKRLINQGQGGGMKRLRPEEGDNYYRILYGPVKTSQIYYPTLIEDSEGGGLKQGIKVLNKPLTGGTPLDPIISLEKRVRRSMGDDKPSSSLYPSSKFLYLVIDKESDDYPTVEVAEFSYSIYKRLVELEQAVSKKKPSKLRHGLIFMWDAIITKTVEHGKPARYGTSYSVEVDPENEFSGKIPAEYLGMEPDELTEHVDFADYFTEEEYEAIQASTLDLEEIGKSDTYEEMEAKLAEFPLFLNATNPDGSFRFPRVDEFYEQIEEMGILTIEEGDEKPALPPATEAPKKKGKKKKPVVEEEEEEDDEELDEEMEVEIEEEIEEEEDEEEEEEAPPKKKGKKKGGKKKPKPKPQEEEEEEGEEEEEVEHGEEEEDFPEW